MGSRTRHSTTTKKGALRKVRGKLDRLSTKQANVLRMRHGIEEDPDDPVGDPPGGCSVDTVERVRAIEDQVLDRARGRRAYSRPESVKKKIVRALKKK